MNIKPYVTVNFCNRCGCPVPRIGVSLRTKNGNISATSPFVCANCRKKNSRKYKNK